MPQTVERDLEIPCHLYEVEVDTEVIISSMIMLRHIRESVTTPFTINVKKEGNVL